MPLYRYKARDLSGQAVAGTLTVDSEEAMVKHLEERGYLPISIEEGGTSRSLFDVSLFSRFTRINERDVNFFTRQLVTLTKAGIPLVSSLQTLRDQTSSGGLKKVISGILADLDQGESFSTALSHHPPVFSELYSSMVRVGETTGQLDEILTRIAELGEYEVEVKTKMVTATFYPKLILFIMFGSFLFITTFVIPRFVSFFEQAGVELFTATKILLWINLVLRHYWFLAVGAAGAAVMALRYFIHMPVGRVLWDGIKLKIPIFGSLFHQFAMSRFARMFSIATRSGVPVLEALSVVSRSIGNVLIAKDLMRIRDSVQGGQGLARPMSQSSYFSPIMVRMVSVGEETGKLDELLLRVSEHYDFEVDNALKRLTILIEPVLLIILGGMVLFMILSIFIPLLRFYTAIAARG